LLAATSILVYDFLLAGSDERADYEVIREGERLSRFGPGAKDFKNNRHSVSSAVLLKRIEADLYHLVGCGAQKGKGIMLSHHCRRSGNLGGMARCAIS
jgi:hypothetical protein